MGHGTQVIHQRIKNHFTEKLIAEQVASFYKFRHLYNYTEGVGSSVGFNTGQLITSFTMEAPHIFLWVFNEQMVCRGAGAVWNYAIVVL